MADVADAFIRGHQAGLAEREHEQQLETNKLRTRILKHEIERMGVEDALRAREVARQNLDLLTGQPAADLPSETLTRLQPNLPARSVAGAMTAPAAAAASRLTGGGDTAGPTTLAAPEAQATEPGTNAVATRVARPLTIPGVPGMGIGDISLRPRSLEDLVRMHVAQQMATPYTLGQGQRRLVGTDVIGEGGPTFHAVGAGGLAATDARGQTTMVAPGRPTVVRPVPGLLNGRRVFATPTAQGGFTINGQPVEGFVPAPSAAETTAADRRDTQKFTQDFREYQSHLGVLQRQHADQVRGVIEANKTALPGEEQEIPDFTPPSFEEWRSQAGRTPSRAAPAATPAQAPPKGTGAAPKKGDTKPIPGYPGTEQTFDGQRWIRTK